MVALRCSPHGLVPEREVVHAPLARRARPEALEDHVGDALGSEHVAAHHRRHRRRVQETPLRDADLDGRKAPLCVVSQKIQTSTNGVREGREKPLLQLRRSLSVVAVWKAGEG